MYIYRYIERDLCIEYRSGDIVFSLAVGTMAYFLNERDNPRAQNGKTLLELVSRAKEKKIREREARRAV